MDNTVAKTPWKRVQLGVFYLEEYDGHNVRTLAIKDNEKIYEGMPVVIEVESDGLNGAIRSVNSATDIISGVLVSASLDATEGEVAHGRYITVQTSMTAGATIDMTHPLMVDPTTKMFVSYDASKASSCIATQVMPDLGMGDKVVKGRMRNYCERDIWLEANAIYAYVPDVINAPASAASSGGASKATIDAAVKKAEAAATNAEASATKAAQSEAAALEAATAASKAAK